MRWVRLTIVAFCLLGFSLLHATIFGTVRGIVHDPQHRPIPDVAITLRAQDSDWVQTQKTNDNGEFLFTAVPIGNYTISVKMQGFQEQQQALTVRSEENPILHFELALVGVATTTVVTAQAQITPPSTVTPTTAVSRQDIERTPGADQINSMAMITDFVPGAYMIHDMLHVRGGHQVSWLIDGIQIPNTNIASNVGPQFDPNDIDFMEVQRGSYSADYGDRTYAAFNVAPRTGFERDKECDLLLSFGNFYQTNDEISCGAHTERFAYYGSLNANRSNLGLETPVPQIIHDAQNGYGGFGSLIFNWDPKDQLRVVTSLRRDHYQIPNSNGVISEDPYFPEHIAVTPYTADTFQFLNDAQRESDAFVTFSWIHTFNSDMILTISPFYHYNGANYAGDPNDFPISTTDDHASHYGGAQTTFGFLLAHNNIQVGLYDFWQHDHQLFSLLFNDASSPNFLDRETISGNLEEEFVADKFKPISWLTLSGGVRQSRFSSDITENVTAPRAGIAVEIPHVHWVFRAFYGHFYQPPPLLTVTGTGSLAELFGYLTSPAAAQGFEPLHGELDKEYQLGVDMPLRGWALDMDYFKTRTSNFFDHNNVGASNVFLPLTIAAAVIQGWETTLRSPKLWRRAQMHLAYSNQLALGQGPVTGGIVNPVDTGFFYLDHDQTNTLNVGLDVTLPSRSFLSGNVSYGSGFANGLYDPIVLPPIPSHLAGETTVDLSVGKSIGERITASVTALNVANKHLLIDNSLTFGGFHFNHPREIFAELRYRFHY